MPAMFSLRVAGNNAAELQQIFLSVGRWSEINDVLHLFTFGLNLWALTELFAGPKGTKIENTSKLNVVG